MLDDNVVNALKEGGARRGTTVVCPWPTNSVPRAAVADNGVHGHDSDEEAERSDKHRLVVRRPRLVMERKKSTSGWKELAASGVGVDEETCWGCGCSW